MIHVITPLYRLENIARLISSLEHEHVQWHPVPESMKSIPEYLPDWIHPIYCPTPNSDWDICSLKNNYALDFLTLQTDDYYCFMCDDSRYEPKFFDKLREKIKTKPQVVVVTARRGYFDPTGQRGVTTLKPIPDNMKPGHVDLGQFIIQGNVLREYRFENASDSDGRLAQKLVEDNVQIAYCPDLFFWYNYFEPGRWTLP